jgi:hypothetical protein
VGRLARLEMASPIVGLTARKKAKEQAKQRLSIQERDPGQALRPGDASLARLAVSG